MDQEDIDRFEKKNLWWIALVLFSVAISARHWFYSSLAETGSGKECNKATHQHSNEGDLSPSQSELDDDDASC